MWSIPQEEVDAQFDTGKWLGSDLHFTPPVQDAGQACLGTPLNLPQQRDHRFLSGGVMAVLSMESL